MTMHGEILMKLSKYTESKLILVDSLNIYKNLYKDLLHQDIPGLLLSLATSCSGCDEMNQTEEYLLLNLEIILKLLEKKSLTNQEKLNEMYAESLKYLSLLYSEQGKSDDAIKYAQQAYRLNIQLYGMNSHQTALSLCHTGKLYKKLIKYAEAEKIFHEVLSISEKCLKNDAVIEALNNLADIYFSQSKYIETEQYLNKALFRLREIQYDGDIASTEQSNSLIAQQLCTLAELKKEINEYEKSREYYEGALLILKTTYGTQHASVAQVLEMLSDLFFERGEERIGKRYRDESIHIYKSLQNDTIISTDSIGVGGNNNNNSGSIIDGVLGGNTPPTPEKMILSNENNNNNNSNNNNSGSSATVLESLVAILSTEEKYDWVSK